MFRCPDDTSSDSDSDSEGNGQVSAAVRQLQQAAAQAVERFCAAAATGQPPAGWFRRTQPRQESGSGCSFVVQSPPPRISPSFLPAEPENQKAWHNFFILQFEVNGRWEHLGHSMIRDSGWFGKKLQPKHQNSHFSALSHPPPPILTRPSPQRIIVLWFKKCKL